MKTATAHTLMQAITRIVATQGFKSIICKHTSYLLLIT